MIPVTRNYSIYVDWLSILANTSITVTALVQIKNTKITRYERTFTNSTPNSSQTDTFNLTSGTLISLCVRDTNRALDWGTTHITLGITRSIPKLGITFIPDILQLATGYISRSHQVSYPIGSNLPILASHGLHRTEIIPNPSPGRNFTFNIATNHIRKLTGIRFLFTSDSNAINRAVLIEITDGTNIIFTTSFISTQAASLAIVYNAFFGINDRGTLLLRQWISIPSITLPKGSTIRSLTSNLQVGDQYSDIVILTEDFITSN